MFEHEKLDGEKFRIVPVAGSFIKEAILELREPKNGAAHDAANRQQYAVAEDVLVERFLPRKLQVTAGPMTQSPHPGGKL